MVSNRLRSRPEDHLNKTEALCSEITKVVVGKYHTYEAHRDILCATLAFFRNAVKSEWANLRKDSSRVELKQEEPEDFELYLHWLYFKTIPKDNMGMHHWQFKLLRAYILGDVLMDSSYKNTAVEALIETFGESIPNAMHVNYIYKHTLPRVTPLRQLLVDAWLYYGFIDSEDEGCWMPEVERCSQEFLADAIKTVMERKASKSRLEPCIPSKERYLEKEEQ